LVLSEKNRINILILLQLFFKKLYYYHYIFTHWKFI
jgi:hypothetical protein